MKVWIFAMAAPAALVPAAASATSIAQQTCTKGADVRVIEVISPGEIGSACDLRYTRDAGSNISVPFNADNATSFCGVRAKDLVASLTAAGYDCTNPGAFEKIATMRQAIDLDAVLAGGPSPRPAAATVAAVPTADQGVIAEVALLQPAPADTAPPAPAPATTATVTEIPAPPPPPVHATGEPVSLATAETPVQATRARYAVGALVGASPEDARPSILAALGEDEQESGDRLPPPQPALADDPTGRPLLDAVSATVRAQAAAWNDGDLPGFMNGFWNDPEFTFITGTTVTKGWKETYQRYRDGYGEQGDLGRLVYSDLETRLLGPDTASVVGRYAFQRGAASGSGALSLVLRRFEGAWRVVQHQMTSDDAAGAAVAAPVGPASSAPVTAPAVTPTAQ